MLERQWTLNDSELVAQEFQRNTEYKPSREQRQREVHLHEVRQIEHYLKIHKPLLSQARRQIIEEKLELEKLAEKNARSRGKKDDYFLKYDYNPLTEKENMRINRSLSARTVASSKTKIRPKDQEMTYEEVNLIDAVRNIKKNNFRRNDEWIMKTSISTQLLSEKIGLNAEKLNYDLRDKLQDNSNQGEEEEELSFDQILALPDKNYYAEKQGPINIFEFMYGNNRSILSNTILLKYYFNFNSCLEKLQKFKIFIYRQLSQVGRALVFKTNIPKSVRLDVLNSNEMSISLKDIRFGDLISVSSGRLDPPLVYSILYEGNAQKDTSPNSSFVDEEDPIHYQQHHHHKKNDYDYKQNFNQERLEYLKLENSPLEAKYEKKYQKVQHNIESSLKEQEKIYKHAIKDVKLHSAYQKAIKKDIDHLISLDRPVVQVEPNKLVRENKRTKNRQERLKIKALLSAIQLTNHYKDKLAPLFNQISKPT